MSTCANNDRRKDGHWSQIHDFFLILELFNFRCGYLCIYTKGHITLTAVMTCHTTDYEHKKTKCNRDVSQSDFKRQRYVPTTGIVYDLYRISLTISAYATMLAKKYLKRYCWPGLRSLNLHESGDFPKYALQYLPRSSIKTSKYSAAEFSGGTGFTSTDVVVIASIVKLVGAKIYNISRVRGS